MPKAENKRKDREQSAANRDNSDFHNYASTSATSEASMDVGDFALSPLPDTPLQSPLTKKGKPSVSDDDSDGIVARLSTIINSRADSLERVVTLKIEGLKKTIDFLSGDITDMKKKMAEIDTKVKEEEGRVSSFENRMAELERYSRRWNLRLVGVPENDQENVKARVIQICQKTVANENIQIAEGIDIVHRINKRDHTKKTPRNIIVQFLSRTVRDALWRAAKQSTFLKDNNLRFAEDLTTADRESRRLLWPLVKEARAQGKTAYFIAGRAFVNGTEIFPPPPTGFST